MITPFWQVILSKLMPRAARGAFNSARRDRMAYEAFLERVFAAVKPSDVIEQVWTREVVDTLDIREAFVNTYRTMCLMPDEPFQRLLQGIQALTAAA